jgi:hypothetical protein
MRQSMLGEEHWSQKVRGELLLGDLPIDRTEWSRTSDRRIVDQDIDAVERLQRRGDDVGGRVRLGDIGNERPDARMVPGCLRQAPGSPADNEDLGAQGRELLRRRSTDPGASTGNQHCPAMKGVRLFHARDAEP